MNKIEDKGRKRRRKENMQSIILGTVATAGILSIGLVAPNVISAMSKLGIFPNPRRKEYVSSSAAKLTKRGLLKFKDGYYQLTPEGEKTLRRWELSNYRLRKPRRWDKQWRIIIYDISEKKAIVRKQVAKLFTQAGFYHLQDSVWIYPYDCEDIIGLLKTDFGVGREILYVIATEVENDRHLRNHFDLIS